MRVHRGASAWRPRPVKRVYIPKAGNRAKLRPLGIPVIMDRCHQARVRNALEPEWESRFEPKSYGFRPGRSCHDAIAVILPICCSLKTKRVWALDADLAAAFDKIDHSRLLEAIGTFPVRDLIREWLKAGVFEKGKGFAPTEEGTPQGGIISPLLMNVALHGLETAAGARYYPAGSNKAGCAEPGSPMVIRYADDLVALCHSQRQAEQVKAAIARWLAPRGLAFNEEKTRIVHINDGYDFLGFNVRRYNGKLLIKPSKAAIQRIRERLRTEFRALRGANAAAVIAKINPITRGWSAYYRGVVSSRIFSSLDNHLWALCYKWATFRHASKPKKWIVARYFGKYNKFRNDHWVFGDAASGAYLAKPSWTGIVRHTMVKGAASPDDPALAEYWATRRRRLAPPLDSYTLRLLTKQDGRCPICRGPVLTADQPQIPPRVGTMVAAHRPQGDQRQPISSTTDGPAHQTVTKPASSTRPASASSSPASAAAQPAIPRRPRGLLALTRGESRTGSAEGRPAGQPAGLTRQVLTSAGAIEVTAPRVNDKRTDPATGERKRFASAILPPWARKTPKVTEVLPLLYLHGLSTGDFVPALESPSSARQLGCRPR